MNWKCAQKETETDRADLKFEKDMKKAPKSAINEECPDTSRHPGYYEKIYLFMNLELKIVFLFFELVLV